MSRRIKWTFLGAMASLILAAQVPNPTQQQPAPQQMNPAPIFRVEVVARSTAAVNYLHRGGSTDINFQGTPIDAAGKGHAKVESVRGAIHVSADFKTPAGAFELRAGISHVCSVGDLAGRPSGESG
jgi:hypothetical protein